MAYEIISSTGHYCISLRNNFYSKSGSEYSCISFQNKFYNTQGNFWLFMIVVAGAYLTIISVAQKKILFSGNSWILFRNNFHGIWSNFRCWRWLNFAWNWFQIADIVKVISNPKELTTGLQKKQRKDEECSIDFKSTTC